MKTYSDLLDIVANLSRRVNSLESQLKDTQTNLERQAEELLDYREDYLACGAGIEFLDNIVEMLTDDIVMLDERTQGLVPKVAKQCPCPDCSGCR